jgi:hypothetical protein
MNHAVSQQVAMNATRARREADNDEHGLSQPLSSSFVAVSETPRVSSGTTKKKGLEAVFHDADSEGCAHGWSALYVYLFWRQRENDKALGSGPLSKVRASSCEGSLARAVYCWERAVSRKPFLVLFPMVLVSAAVFWMFSSVLARCACVFSRGAFVTMLLRVGGFFNGTRCVPCGGELMIGGCDHRANTSRLEMNSMRLVLKPLNLEPAATV